MYECLGRMTRAKCDEHRGKYRELSQAYDQLVKAVDNLEVGWGLFVCQK